MRRLSPLLIPFTALLATTAQAQDTVTTSISPTRPPQVATIAHEDPDSNGWQWRWTADTGRRDLGQTFTAPTNFALRTIAIEIRSGSVAAVSRAPFHLTLSQYPDARATIASAQLGSWPGVLPDNDKGVAYQPGLWLCFNIPPVKLEKDAVYGFTLSFDAAGPSGKGIVFAVPPKETYPEGYGLFSTDGTAWQRNLDLNFLLIANDAATLAHTPRVLVVDRTGGGEFKTLDAATRLAQPGDTIRVKPNTGPYREVLYIPGSGTKEAPITFDGGGNVITGFEPLTGWTEQDGAQTVRLPIFPCVLTYKGERLRQDFATGQFTKYATLNETKDTLTLLPGAGTEGWEISKRPFAVRIYNTSYQTYRNVRASGSTNDGFNLHGTGTGLAFENIEGFQNQDEGFSAHDDIQSSITGGKFWDNDNGIGNVGRSKTEISNLTTWSNLGYGLWLEGGTGSVTNARSWGNGVCQVLFTNLHLTVDKVTAYKPPFASKPWISYMESKTASTMAPYVSKASEITGTVETSDLPEPK